MMKVVRPLGQVYRVKEGLKQNPKEMNMEGSKESDIEWPEGKRVTHVKLSVPSFIPFTGVTSGDRAVLTQYFMALDAFAFRKKYIKFLLEPTLSHNASIIYYMRFTCQQDFSLII